ncbi:hypothetical protein T439DRAFT_377419 [Meredithblackwellia eburnea MCA 4105]
MRLRFSDLRHFELEYSLTRPYPWRWYTGITMVFFFLLLVGLFVINVALVGYDLVSVSTNDFNKTHQEWWHGISSLRKQQESCQPATLSVGESFRTSNGGFDYNIDAIGNPDGTFTLPSEPSIQYSNSPISGCDVVNMSVSATGLIFRSVFTATIVCPQPFPVRATATWIHGSPDEDTYVKFLGQIGSSLLPSSQSIQALQSSIAVAIQDTIAATNDDFINQNRDDSASAFLFNFVAQPSCSGSLCSASDKMNPTVVNKNPDYNWNRVSFAGDFEYQSTPEWGFSSNLSLRNTFQVLLNAVRLDLGTVYSNNIFTNMSALQNTIVDTNTFYTYQLRTSGKGYRSLSQLPLAHNNSNPTVVRVGYLCSEAKLKNGASLLSSVLASTMTMVLVVWGVWGLMAGIMAKRHHRVSDRMDLEDPERRFFKEQVPLATPPGSAPGSRTSGGIPDTSYDESKQVFGRADLDRMGL